MEKITLHIKDKSKLNLLLEWLKQFDFVEIQETKSEKPTHSFFDSAGRWKNRDITTESIRKKAWGGK